jgi:hypothetical protein
MEQMIAPRVLQRSFAIRTEFQGAKPFRHVCIEDFFLPEYAERLLQEFPKFNPKDAINEFGEVGGKAVKTDIRSIGPNYDRLFTYISSPAFLRTMSDMLGIPDLLCDASMYGGGTHENLPGQELDPHVDFNYDQERKLHRRVNLLLYLNKEWDESWGGAIELHSDPRDWVNDQVKAFNCNFNRCVIFETNEYSWHGFKRIAPPPEKRDLTRKCISIYLYTKDRPKEEIAPLHGTFYVQRPLPPEICAGRTLTTEDQEQLNRLLVSRDGWIKFYQNQELKFSANAYAHEGYIRELQTLVRLPLTGYILQKQGSVQGAYPDGWVGSRLSVELEAQQRVKRLLIRGWAPDSNVKGQILKAMINGLPAGQCALAPGQTFDWKLDVPKGLKGEFVLNVETEGLERAGGDPGDTRDLSFVLKELRAEH